jgi:hypothetical protein
MPFNWRVEGTCLVISVSSFLLLRSRHKNFPILGLVTYICLILWWCLHCALWWVKPKGHFQNMGLDLVQFRYYVILGLLFLECPHPRGIILHITPYSPSLPPNIKYLEKYFGVFCRALIYLRTSLLEKKKNFIFTLN